MSAPVEDDYISVREVARILLVTEWRVRELIRAGSFPNARRPGRSYLVPRSDVKSYIINKDKENRQ